MKFAKFGLLTAGVAVASVSSFAIPLLQLDAIPGSYNLTTEDSVPSGQSFTLRALLTPSKNDSVSDLLANTYYVSTALTGSGSANGSFSFGGNTVNISDLANGTPSQLPSHGIFDALFKEFSFQFSAGQTVSAYNVADGSGPGGNDGSTSYYYDFVVDTSHLDVNHALHFDLYSYTTKQNGNTEINNAPFSHDASSLLGGGLPPDGGPNGGPVPDGGATAVLLGLGSLALGLVRSRK